MENFFYNTTITTTSSTTSTTSTASTTTTSLLQPDMGYAKNCQFSICEQLSGFYSSTSATSQLYSPAPCTPPYQDLHFPYAHPLEQAGQPFVYPTQLSALGQNGIQFVVSHSIEDDSGIEGGSSLSPPSGLRAESWVRDPYRTKFARIRRKLARQRSLSLSRNSSSGASSSIIIPSSAEMNARRQTAYGAATEVQNSNNIKRGDLFQFYTLNNKQLRVLLTKELKNSDVGSLGRIVLPKREAEENLPILSSKEGIPVVIRDMYSDKVWRFKYKFWTNNKSRMYVFENTGEFVRQNGLEKGDFLALFEDQSKNLYFSAKKVEKVATEPYKEQQTINNDDYNNSFMPFSGEAVDEDEASFEVLIEQLKHKEQQEANNLMTLPIDGASSHT